jgi:hypothetical protein
LPSPFRLALQISSSISRLQSLHRHSHTKHPASIRSSTPSNGLATFQQIRIDHTFAILRAARSVFRIFPSRPIDPGARDLSQAFRHLSKAPRVHWHRGFPSIPIRSALRAIVPPLRSISRSLAVTPERAVVKPPRLSRPASSFISHVPFTDPPSLRSLVPLSFGSAHS